jgi:hypothetical protein
MLLVHVGLAAWDFALAHVPRLAQKYWLLSAPLFASAAQDAVKGSQGAGKVDESLDRTNVTGSQHFALCRDLGELRTRGWPPLPQSYGGCRAAANSSCAPPLRADEPADSKAKAPARPSGGKGKKGKGRR